MIRASSLIFCSIYTGSLVFNKQIYTIVRPHGNHTTACIDYSMISILNRTILSVSVFSLVSLAEPPKIFSSSLLSWDIWHSPSSQWLAQSDVAMILNAPSILLLTLLGSIHGSPTDWMGSDVLSEDDGPTHEDELKPKACFGAGEELKLKGYEAQPPPSSMLPKEGWSSLQWANRDGRKFLDVEAENEGNEPGKNLSSFDKSISETEPAKPSVGNLDADQNASVSGVVVDAVKEPSSNIRLDELKSVPFNDILCSLVPIPKRSRILGEDDLLPEFEPEAGSNSFSFIFSMLTFIPSSWIAVMKRDLHRARLYWNRPCLEAFSRHIPMSLVPAHYSNQPHGINSLFKSMQADYHGHASLHLQLAAHLPLHSPQRVEVWNPWMPCAEGITVSQVLAKLRAQTNSRGSPNSLYLCLMDPTTGRGRGDPFGGDELITDLYDQLTLGPLNDPFLYLIATDGI